MPALDKLQGRHGLPPTSRLATEKVWAALDRANYAVLSYVNPAGRPRASGVIYAVEGHRLYVATDPDSWKARALTTGDQVSVTVAIRRGGPLSLVAPLPPATIAFHARVTVHPPGSVDVATVSRKLASYQPAERRTSTLLELMPEDAFLTYGFGVSLRDMTRPSAAQARAPVGARSAA